MHAFCAPIIAPRANPISGSGGIVVEVFRALWKHAYVNEGRTGDQHDAFTVASWLREADREGRLCATLRPKPLTARQNGGDNGEMDSRGRVGRGGSNSGTKELVLSDCYAIFSMSFSQRLSLTTSMLQECPDERNANGV